MDFNTFNCLGSLSQTDKSIKLKAEYRLWNMYTSVQATVYICNLGILVNHASPASCRARTNLRLSEKFTHVHFASMFVGVSVKSSENNAFKYAINIAKFGVQIADAAFTLFFCYKKHIRNVNQIIHDIKKQQFYNASNIHMLVNKYVLMQEIAMCLCKKRLSAHNIDPNECKDKIVYSEGATWSLTDINCWMVYS